MSHYLDFDLYGLGPSSAQRDRIAGAGGQGVLVVFQTEPDHLAEEQAYLEKILAASGFADPAVSCYLLPLFDEEAVDWIELQLATPPQHLVFLGIAPARGGLAVRTGPYQLIRLNGRIFLFGDSVADIYAERQSGGKAKSGALWRALKKLNGHD
jgi:hypothetical protein